LWYAIPSLVVALVGLATCSLIDITDFDTFRVEASVANANGTRSAVVVRQWHSDSSATVKCIWLVPGAPPSTGHSMRMAPTCALIATDPGLRLELQWQTNGRLRVTLPPGTTTSASDPIDSRCYYETETLGPRHVCYVPHLLDAATTQ
jgi:hypothetical protein